MRIKLTKITLYIATTLKFVKKFDHPFSHVFMFSNMFPESKGFVVMPISSSDNFESTMQVKLNDSFWITRIQQTGRKKLGVIFDSRIFFKCHI